ncbi:Pycsar system effector family protein [Streptomyces sp. UH6]|uniref:Pycsar system effector family protein n=1 Tax=Streptomyces sp. UH6 TaxID=2748379 RepID=UPI0015D4C615|nr:Pycsar system effector family protein [Streptomyces sp. UH6]NYV73158.1 hypothetical protein [Streptomyces sp. UH6]
MTSPDPVASDPGAGSPRSQAGIAERLLADLRTEIARADTKASVLVAALGITAGAFSGLIAGQKWSPSDLTGAGAPLWWVGCVALVVSLISLLSAVWPRYRRATWTPGHPLSYFGDIQQAARLGLLDDALRETGRDPAAGLSSALAESSRIATRKHQWIRLGLFSYCAGVITMPISLLIG